MAKNIALQLYTLRDQAAKNYADVVRKVAQMGYPGVETAGFPGTTPEAAAKVFEETGLIVTSAHMPLPLGDKKHAILETMDALGKPPLVCTQIGPDDVKTMAAVSKLCEQLNEGAVVAREHGLKFGIHNHWWEFETLDGRLIHHIMLELLSPEIFFELDTYWIKVAGQDPVEFVRALGCRVPMMHIKDGPAVREAPQTAVGEGVVDIPAIIGAAGEDTWKIVELDHCATDVMVAVKESYNYLMRI